MVISRKKIILVLNRDDSLHKIDDEDFFSMEFLLCSLVCLTIYRKEIILNVKFNLELKAKFH